MIAALGVGMALALAAPGSSPLVADTTIAVVRGDRVRIETPAGAVSVRTWERDEVRLTGTTERTLLRTSGVVRLTGRNGRPGRREDLELMVPTWIEIGISGQSVRVDVTGTAGDLTVQTLEGDVTLAGTRGRVSARTVSGAIWARDVRGVVQLYTVEGDVVVEGAGGRLGVGSTDGDLTLRGVDADEVVAETTDGDVRFEGQMPAGSRVALTAHDGDLDVTLPSATNADVRVSTFDGEFRPEFTVEARGFRAGEALRFVLGQGGAGLELQTFDGDIVLRRR